MIIEQNDLVNYEDLNKVYIPNGYKNNNYKYNFDGDYIIIRTNENCRTTYNTTYCNCRAYNMKNNVMSEIYECNYTNDNNKSINIQNITNDINDSMYIRERFIQEKGLYIGIFIIGIIFAILITKRGSYK